MNWNVFFLAAAMGGLALLTACDKEEEDEDSLECSFVLPQDESVWMRGDVIYMNAAVIEGTAPVWGVSFYVDGNHLADDSIAPYEAIWQQTDTVSLGAYNLYAIAWDEDGKTHSHRIGVLINNEGGFNPDLEYGTMEDQDGNTYRTIQIGDQEWMAENLRSTHTADGSALPLVNDNTEWAALEADAQAYCWYNNADTTKGYGALYTREAALEVCPDGWHLPSDEEWMMLETSLGMDEAETGNLEWRGTDTGNLLKEEGYSHWEFDNRGTNESGFTALPAGFRSHSGSFYGYYAYLWSATEESNTGLAWYRSLLYSHGGVFRGTVLKQNGMSVRCVKD